MFLFLFFPLLLCTIASNNNISDRALLLDYESSRYSSKFFGLFFSLYVFLISLPRHRDSKKAIKCAVVIERDCLISGEITYKKKINVPSLLGTLFKLPFIFLKNGDWCEYKSNC